MTDTQLSTDVDDDRRARRGAGVFIFSIFSYAVACGTFFVAAGFLQGFVVPKTLEDGPDGPILSALLVDFGLLALFGLHHSIAARERFKDVVRRFVPPSAERATYVLASSLLLLLVVYAWRPIPGALWTIADPTARAVMNGVYAFGWLLLLASTHMIDHFELFGLRQAFAAMRRERFVEPAFKTPGLYRVVRHQIYVAWMIVFWAAPDMTFGRLLFAASFTAYILIAIGFEERDLVRRFGAAYEAYRARTPALLPLPRRAA
jgi:methanethiol S-methyltransferase